MSEDARAREEERRITHILNLVRLDVNNPEHRELARQESRAYYWPEAAAESLRTRLAIKAP